MSARHRMAFDSAHAHPDPRIRAAAAGLGPNRSGFRIDKSQCRWVPADPLKAKEATMTIPRRRLGMDASPADEALAQLRAFLQER